MTGEHLLGEEAPDGLREDSGFEFHLLPGEPGDPPAGELNLLLSSTVVDKGNVRFMKPTTVSFEDQALRAPEEIRLIALASDLESDVDFRLRQPSL